MNKNFRLLVVLVMVSLPVLGWSQVTPKDSLAKAVTDTAIMKPDTTHPPVIDTVKVVIDTIVKKDCYTEYYEIMRTRGAKPVTDGMQQVVIAFKSPDGSCLCFMGQIEVAAHKIKPPLYFRKENGEYKPVSTVGKKLEAAFAGSMSPDELYTIKDGMSIVFRTSDNEYGRLFFYQFVNKGSQGNAVAPSASELIKE